MRLRTSLYLVAAATAAPLLVFAVLAAAFVFTQERSAVINSARANNRAVLAAVDAELRGTVGVLLALTGTASLERDDLEGFARDARATLTTQPSWQNIVLQRPSGAQLVNARVPRGAALPDKAFELDSLEAVVASGKPAFANLTFAPLLGGEPGVSVRVPVVRGGRTVYVLTAVLNPRLFQAVLEAQRLPPEWVLGLVGSDGRLIARIPSVPAGTLASNAFREHAASAPEGWYRGATLEGADTYTAFARSPLTGWTIGYALPARVILGEAQRAAALMAAGIGLSVITAVLIAYWLSRRIVRPMSELADAARQLGSGTPMPLVASRVDEVERLSVAIAKAGQALEQRDRELQRSQHELREQAAELKRADANKVKFLALLSHELRNPLAPLRAGLALLSRGGDAARQAETRAMMDRQIGHMARLIEDLVDIGRIDRGQLELRRERIDIDEVVRNAVQTAMPGVEAKRQQLVVRCAPGERFVNGDAVRLGQVISNLLNNASKYTPEDGHLEASVDADVAEVVITVRDDGAGFDAAQAARIFELFVRLDETRERHAGGLGVGLTIARALVEAHGGRVDATSDGPGRGATFTVRLPRAAAPAALPPSPAPVQRRGPTRRVLVADDNRDAADALADLLRGEGFSVRVAYDGEQALEAAQAFDPDVAFLDLDMPRLSGLEVAGRLRAGAAPRRAALIALTGLGQPDDLRRTREAGFDLHLTKPAEPDEVIRLASGAGVAAR